MLKLPIKPKHSLAPLIVLLVCAALAATQPFTSQYLAYDRVAIGNLEIWRLLSGHLLHTNVMHFILNAAGLSLLWALHGFYYTTKTYLGIFVGLSIGTAVGLYLFSSNMQWYVGLSGVLHGLFMVGAYFDIRHKLTTGWLLLIGVWVKVIHEQFYGASADVAQLIDAHVAIDAHLYGTVAGSLLIVVMLLKSNTTNSG